MPGSRPWEQGCNPKRWKGARVQKQRGRKRVIVGSSGKQGLAVSLGVLSPCLMHLLTLSASPSEVYVHQHSLQMRRPVRDSPELCGRHWANKCLYSPDLRAEAARKPPDSSQGCSSIVWLVTLQNFGPSMSPGTSGAVFNKCSGCFSCNRLS